MSEGTIKRITGRTPLVVRDLLSKPFSFVPTFKIWLDTNHLPRFRGQDRAMWNRVRRIPFRKIITREEQLAFREKHGNLDALLAAEASGILNIALHGWKTYCVAGTLHTPESIINATTDYQQLEDSLGEFIEDCCTVGAECSVPKSELFAQYCEWAKDHGEYAPTAKRLGMWMLERGFADAKSGGLRMWRGITVRETRRERSERLSHGDGALPF